MKEDTAAERVDEVKYVEEEEDTSSDVSESDLVSVQRYMVFYDGKCRNCMFNVMNSTLDSNLMVNPTFVRSIKCHLKVQKHSDEY